LVYKANAHLIWGLQLLKVLNVNHLLDPHTGGGTAERTIQMSRALSDASIDCRIITLDIGLDERLIDQLKSVAVMALPCINKRFFIPSVSYNTLLNAVKNVDIIHIMGHWTILNALVYKVANHIGKPYVVCPAGALPIFGRSKLIKTLYNKIIGQNIVRNAEACIAISPDEIDHFKNYGVSSDKATIIRNGINPTDFQLKDESLFRTEFSLNNIPYILFMGRLNSIKGPDLLLEAFCRIADNIFPYRLVFAGPDGGMLETLKAIAKKHHCEDRVRFLGYVGGNDKAQAYNEADLLAIPSRQEAMSIVVIEAGATATPVLITDQCGFNVVDEIGGGKVVTATIDGLSKGLLELIEKRKQLKTMGNNLKRYTLENYTWESLVNQLLSLYRNILSDTNSR
jgi:glycosyltransferase involved in cell wall biosynthesis